MPEIDAFAVLEALGTDKFLSRSCDYWPDSDGKAIHTAERMIVLQKAANPPIPTAEAEKLIVDWKVKVIGEFQSKPLSMPGTYVD